MRLLFGLTVLAASVFATPAMASDARIAIDGYDYVVPAPKGYCGDGPVADAFSMRMRDRMIKPGQIRLAAMITPCRADVASSEFYIITVDQTQMPTTRDAYLTIMRRTMPVTLTAEAASDPAQIGQRLAEALRDRSATAARVHPIGVNSICGLSVSAVSRTITGTVSYTLVACTSVVQKRIVRIFRYVPGADFDTINAALPEMSRMIESIRSDATT